MVTTAFSSLLWGEKRGLTPRPPDLQKEYDAYPNSNCEDNTRPVRLSVRKLKVFVEAKR